MSVFEIFKTSRQSRFTNQIQPHLQNLYKQAYRLTGSQENAEDLVQDLLIRLYEKDIDFNNIEKPHSWLLRSLYNQFIDNYRKKNRLVIDQKDADSTDIIDSLADQSQSPAYIAEQSLTAKTLQQAIATLNPDQQALIALHDVEGHTLQELSEILDTPTGTLKSRLHRARQSLRENLSKDQNPGNLLQENDVLEVKRI